MLRVDSILKNQVGQFEKILCAVIFRYLFLQQVQQSDDKSTCSTAFEIEIPGTAVKQNMKSLDEVTCCSPALAAKSRCASRTLVKFTSSGLMITPVRPGIPWGAPPSISVPGFSGAPAGFSGFSV